MALDIPEILIELLPNGKTWQASIAGRNRPADAMLSSRRFNIMAASDDDAAVIAAFDEVCAGMGEFLRELSLHVRKVG